MSAAEKTPLTSDQPTALQSAGKVVSDLATAENVQLAAGYAKGKIQEAYKLATDANTPLRMLALAGGAAMAVTSILSVLGKFVSLHIGEGILSIYCFFLGATVVLLEGKVVPFHKEFERKVEKYVLLLNYVWGRGVFYFFAGSLQFIQWNIIDTPVGAFMMFVGFSYYIMGKSTSKKLSELRKSIFSEEELRKRFDEVDITGKGEIDFDHFKVFVERLGLVLSPSELQAAFDNVDIDHGGTIEFEEFLLWWRQWDFDQVEKGTIDVEV